MSKAVKIYSAAVLLIAFFLSASVYFHPAGCGDSEGHGPDPGTVECLASIARQNADRPLHTLFLFLGICLTGAVMFGLFAALRALKSESSSQAK